MSEDNYEKAFLDLNVKVTEMAGDVKLVLHRLEQSDKDREAQTRRLDRHEEEIDLIKIQIAEHKTATNVLKGLFAGTLSLLLTAAAILALIFH